MKNVFKKFWNNNQQWMGPLLLIILCCIVIGSYIMFEPWRMVLVSFPFMKLKPVVRILFAATTCIFVIHFIQKGERWTIPFEIFFLLLSVVFCPLLLVLIARTLFAFFVVALLGVFALLYNDHWPEYPEYLDYY